MDVKRYFRAPIMWIVLAVLAVIVLMQVVSDSNGYKTVDTGQVVAAIDAHNVKSAQITTGDSNTIKIQLKDGATLSPAGTGKAPSGTKFQASYIGDQGVAIADKLQSQMNDRSSALTEGYTVSPEKQSTFVSLLLSMLPIVIIVLVFLFLMNQMQGGGSRVMQFGKSKAKLLTKDTPKTTCHIQRV